MGYKMWRGDGACSRLVFSELTECGDITWEEEFGQAMGLAVLIR